MSPKDVYILSIDTDPKRITKGLKHFSLKGDTVPPPLSRHSNVRGQEV